MRQADSKEYNKYLFSVLGLGDDNVPVEIVHFGSRHGKGQTMARKKVPKFVLKINEIGSVKKAQLMSKGKPAGMIVFHLLQCLLTDQGGRWL